MFEGDRRFGWRLFQSDGLEILVDFVEKELISADEHPVVLNTGDGWSHAHQGESDEGNLQRNRGRSNAAEQQDDNRSHSEEDDAGFYGEPGNLSVNELEARHFNGFIFEFVSFADKWLAAVRQFDLLQSVGGEQNE